ncbi:MAG: SGNH/GDSL hydrolase family protein [Flavobacteriaceae bacterium]|nr:SGNH/GDSL hydrolase family protein [Flavobacteriaceae bacterium]
MQLLTLTGRLTILFFLCLIGSTEFSYPQDSKDAQHIVFIGNSLTYTNDLPKLVRQEAKKKGIKVKSKLIAYPNYGLEDHWNDGKVQKLIKNNTYDFVIIQQGPSSQAYGRSSLLEYGKKLKELCDKYDSKLVYFMVWPSRQYDRTFEGVIKNYTDAAQKNDAILCPVGKVWKDYFDETNDFSYYSEDSFHPSLKGSKVAAEVIVKTLFSN